METKTIIFGTGSTGNKIYNEIRESDEVIGFLDNDEAKWGGEFCGKSVLGNAGSLLGTDYDRIIVASLPGLYVIRDELLAENIPADKIDISFVETQVLARINFLRDYSSMTDMKNVHTVAEGGVFQGDFAKEINQCFPEAKLYLFDTFDGFDERDLAVENENNYYSLSDSQ